MRAGRLRHKIQIQANTEVVESDGFRSAGWATISGGTVRAEIRPVRGREFQSSDQIQSETTFMCLIRHSSAVASVDDAHRIVWGSRKFAITAPPRNIGERDRWIEIELSEGVQDDG